MLAGEPDRSLDTAAESSGRMTFLGSSWVLTSFSDTRRLDGMFAVDPDTLERHARTTRRWGWETLQEPMRWKSDRPERLEC